VKTLLAVALCTVVSLALAVADNVVELSLEYRLMSDSEGIVHLKCEHWPATIEAYVAPIGSARKDEASIVFSLSNIPATHERLRVGFLVEADDPDDDFLPRRQNRDDRAYLYARSEFPWGTARVLYPVAISNNGHFWYPRVELRDLDFPLYEREPWSLSAIGDISYDFDPTNSFRYNYGVRVNWDEAWLSATRDYVAVGWTMATVPWSP